MNGKFILIGMYTGAVVVPEFPFNMGIRFAVWAKGEPGQAYKCDFAVVCEPKSDTLSGVEVEFEIEPGESQVFLPLPLLPVKLLGAGDLVLRDNESGAEIIRLKVSSSKSPPQPSDEAQFGNPNPSIPIRPSRKPARKESRKPK
jgi:hypothetical protein